MSRRPQYLAWRLVVLLLVAWLPAATQLAGLNAAAQSVRSPQRDFREVLAEAGFDHESFRAFEAWNGEITSDDGAILARLLFRLQQYEAASSSSIAARQSDQTPTANGLAEALKPGDLVQLAGAAVAAEAIELPSTAAVPLERTTLHRCEVKLPDGSIATVLTLDAPVAWKSRKPLDEPTSLQAVLLGSAAGSGERRPLLLATRMSWRPSTNASPGVLWLAKRGFDASLLDDVRHNQAFATTGAGYEAEAFYDCLQLVADSQPQELARLAYAGLPSVAENAQQLIESSEQAIRRLEDQCREASPAERSKLKAAIKRHREKKQVAEWIVARASGGLSSVWRAYLEPKQSAGDAFVIEGVARRAVRIVVEDDAWDRPQFWPLADNAARAPLREYYELDVFSSDPQHPPAICCVARLPAGFPVGEVIREPVRVAGIFFKNWAYARRMVETSTSKNQQARIAPPLFLAAEPQWIRTAPNGAEHRWEIWAGGVFLVLFAGGWAVLARISRRDRLARLERARYDLPFIGEP